MRYVRLPTSLFSNSCAVANPDREYDLAEDTYPGQLDTGTEHVREGIKDLEQLLGPLNWFEVPNDLITVLSGQDQIGMTKATLGILKGTTATITWFENDYEVFRQQFWRNNDGWSMDTRLWSRGTNGDTTARIHYFIQAGPDMTRLYRHHHEQVLDGDVNGARCSAILKYIERIRRLEEMRANKVPSVIVTNELGLIARSRADIKALFGSLAPPSPVEAKWEEKLVAYLRGFGMKDEVIKELLNGDRPANVGLNFVRETYAELSRIGEFRVTKDTEKNGNVLVHFPTPPNTRKGRREYYAELRQLFEAAQAAIADLSRIKELVLAHNQPVKFQS